MYVDSIFDMIKISIIAGVIFGSVMGGFILLMTFSLLHGIIYGMCMGIPFGGLGLIFSIIQYILFRKKNINFIDEKQVLAKGFANHVKGKEYVGGYLFLTADNLIFQSHNFNIQNHKTIIPINEIIKIEKVKTRGIVPNGLNLITNDGIETYVVYNRSKWISIINKYKTNREII